MKVGQQRYSKHICESAQQQLDIKSILSFHSQQSSTMLIVKWKQMA
jgi:hypothetical protein